MESKDKSREELARELDKRHDEITTLKQTLEEKEKQKQEVKHLEMEQCLSIFDGIDTPVYVVDPGTYEVLYANKAIKDMLGDVKGKKCHEAFQALEFPCSFCTNKYIFGEEQGKVYIWDFRNRFNGRWYHCIDKAIQWLDGRNVRFEIAIDITDRKQIEDAFKESESKSKALLNAIPDLMFQIRRDGTFMNFKAARVEMLLVPPNEFLGKKVKDVLPVDIADLTMENINAVIGTDNVQVYEYSLTFPSQQVRYFECRMVACGEDEVVAIVRDITERKRTEEALVKSRRLLERAFYNLSDTVFLFNADLTGVLDCNPAAVKVFGYDRKELLKCKPSMLFCDEQQFTMFKEQLSEIVKHKGFLTGATFTMKRRDTSRFTANYDIVLLDDESGNRIGWVCIVSEMENINAPN
jgi:PAS domain S-box-containing protein